jgi:hypothetical protein
MGRFVPGSVITPMEQDSFPCSIAARSVAQKSSSCARMRAIAYNKSSSAKQPAFHLNIALSLGGIRHSDRRATYTPKMNKPLLLILRRLFAGYQTINRSFPAEALLIGDFEHSESEIMLYSPSMRSVVGVTMPPLDNPRHEAFAQALFEGLGTGQTHGQSYSAAGYTSNPSAAKVNASRLLNSTNHIIERVQELQAQAARHKRVTVEAIVDELEGARQIARENNQASAMVAASTAKAKILGLEINRSEVGKPGDFGPINSKDELAEKYLLEANPDAIITAIKRTMVIAELERHMAAISAIAADNDCRQQ